MANYYNVTGWKLTGFTPNNRPWNREVLALPEFKESARYFQMAGMAVNREDMLSIDSIDLQGSVKDVTGTQVNPPNITGSQGLHGPWYSLEEIDYIRLTRTGYPGDEDFIDISGNIDDPWNAPHEGKKDLRVGYYFVTGLEPLARNVTRVHLMCDVWLTCGASDDITIENGFKIQGTITDAEDASTFNMCAEPITPVEPLEVITYKKLAFGDAGDPVGVIVSGTDLSQYDEPEALEGISVQTPGGATSVVPSIKGDTIKMEFQMFDPFDNSRKDFNIRSGFGCYDPDYQRTRDNINYLYSCGQLELSSSYSIPKKYCNGYHVGDEHPNRWSVLAGTKYDIAGVGKDITGYPRKADYMYGSLNLVSLATGSTDSEAYSEITNTNIGIWSVPVPNGSPFARFKGIKGHPYLYDRAVQGMQWLSNSVMLEGASGSLWTQAEFAQAQNQRAIQQLRDLETYGSGMQPTETDFYKSLPQYGEGASLKDKARGLVARGATFALSAVSDASTVLRGTEQFLAGKGTSGFSEGYYRSKEREIGQATANLGLAKSMLQAPIAEFTPSPSASAFEENGFAVYSINTSATDRKRLKDYFKRYGYNGLYKPLTWDEIDIKQKVNFVKCQGVVLRHKYYPWRYMDRVAEVLENGCFFWKGRPNMADFDNNPDKV